MKRPEEASVRVRISLKIVSQKALELNRRPAGEQKRMSTLQREELGLNDSLGHCFDDLRGVRMEYAD